jgi:hypothetical protein
LGFPTGWSFTTHQATAFSGTAAGEEWKTSARGVFCTHILYFVLLFCFTLFLPASFYIKNPKKLESLVVVISLLLVHHVVP